MLEDENEMETKKKQINEVNELNEQKEGDNERKR